LRRATGPSGFTFIEMMIVVAILSLLASIVVVNLDGISAPTRLRGAARQIGNQVAELKDMAALRNRLMSIEFDLENQRWRVVDAPTENDVPDPQERDEDTFVGTWDPMPPGVRLREVAFSATDVDQGGTTVITFNGDGEVVPSGFVAFLSADRMSDEEGISVEVSGLTGLVSYHPGHFKAEEIRRAEDF
jgi:prepilin-type N-terminal cleavage/methylation domain-containing protein